MKYTELFKLISKQWASAKDIMLIGDIGRDSAISVRNIISEDIIESGKKLPKSKSKVIPMKSLIEYYNIDVNYIAKMAKMESEIRKEEK